MMNDLKDAASISGELSIAQMQSKLYKELKEQSEEFLRRYLNVKQRHENSDKVFNEMTKQIASYKEEIENMKQMEE